MFNARIAALTLLFSVLLASCGGGGGSGSVAVVEPATVGLIVTDASVEDWDQALATITSVQLIGEDGRDTLFDGRKTVDLLQLRDFVEVFEIDEDVQPGTYSKIRLRVEQLTLVKLDDDGEVEEERDARLVANGKIDLNPRGDIEIAPGAILFITLDFDLDKSFKLTETGNGALRLRPVVFVEINTAPGFRGLARIQGTVAELSDNLDGFLLCRTQLAATPESEYSEDDIPDDRPRCLRVTTDGDTGVFGEDGLPIDPLNLAEGDTVTVIGRLARRMDQPEVDAISQDDDDDSGDDDDRHEPFVLNAFIIEQGLGGTWERIRGIAQSAIANDTFSLAIGPAQGYAPETLIDARVFPETRLFSPRGDELDRDAVQADTRVLVDAVLAISDTDPDVLRTALIIVGEDAARESLEAELLSVDGDMLMIATDDGDRCVLGADATVLRITNADLDIDEIALNDLEAGEALELFGAEDSVSGCFAADVIVAKPTSPEL